MVIPGRARERANPESRNDRNAYGWIPDSALRTVPE
jgi:hypothetical protein